MSPTPNKELEKISTQEALLKMWSTGPSGIEPHGHLKDLSSDFSFSCSDGSINKNESSDEIGW